MAITITHAPDMGSLAMAGYYAGAGEDRRWQAEMMFRDRSEQRQIQANFLQQQLQQQHMLERQSFGAQLDQQQQFGRFGQQALLQQNNQDFQRQMHELEVADRADRIQMDFKNRMLQQLMADSTAAEADQNQFAYRVADDVMSSINDMLANGYDFTDEDRQRYQAGVQEINKVLQDSTLRAHQRAQAAMKAAQLLPIPQRRIPSTEEVVEESVVVRDYALPNGQTVKALLSLDRDNKPRLLTTFEPEQPDAMEGMSIADQVTASPEVFLKFWSQASKELAGTGPDAAMPSEAAIRQRVQSMIQAAPSQQESPANTRTTSQQQPRTAPAQSSNDIVDLEFDQKSGTWKPTKPRKTESFGLGVN